MIRPAQPPPSLVLPGPYAPPRQRLCALTFGLLSIILLPSADSSPLRSILLLGPAGPRSPRPRSPVGLSGALNGAARGAKLMSPSSSSSSSSSSELAPRASLLLLRLSSASESLPGLGDLIVEVGVHVHAQVVAGPAALAGGEEVLLVEHLVRHAIFPTVKPKTFLGVRNLIVQIPHLARLLAFGNVLESVLPRGLGLGELLRELLPPHRLGVLLLLPPLLADLVQALGHPGGLQPRAAEVLDVQAAAVHLLLVGAEARERRSFYEQLARAAGGRVVLLLLLGGAAMVVVALVVGAEEGGLGYGVAGGGVPDRVRLFVTELEGRHSNGDGGAREELTSRGVRSGRRPNMAACPCQIGSAIERGGSGGVYTWTEVSPIELATVRSC
ncbi:hypothetical protein ColTof4_11535 [Colletotrichum tofieldiae]|nr:hypothetical protein ColTof4_11535 [Colletotrichum tofieldiae]